ncbi:PiggyBac transposable element-derived protein 4-like [Plakobranchus ocellatus]|uniref:PiggyBac transposable element-derived protein 4-like n=1 Tax=Plakobranchus ocellatus TaxID=259542 RepID=A0AAV4AII4_9GAST|nr:PiggyBac transposable element-derived protein 4-like [Plakobranchus ocellatus]
MANHLGKNQSVHFDNFFSSIKLAKDLLKEKLTCCGTIRPNRKGWPMPNTKQKPGKVRNRMMQKGRMVAVQWTDKRQVNILSANADPKMVTVERRTKHGVVQVQVPKPVLQYNSATFGVDLNDQNRSCYPVGRPGTKWGRYLFSYLERISIINAFIVMKCARPDDSYTSVSQNYLPFRTRLVKALIATIKPDQPVRRAPDTLTLEGSTHSYSPGHSFGKMPGHKRRFFQCAQVGVKMASRHTQETITGCHLCNVHLHGGACYSRFHDNLKSQISLCHSHARPNSPFKG